MMDKFESHLINIMTELTYAAQLEQKAKNIKTLFASLLSTEQLRHLETYPSSAQHYRLRAEFRVWHHEEDLYPIMFDQTTKKPYKIETFPAGSALINQALNLLFPLLKQNHILRFKLFQVDFLSTLSGQLLISMLYHKKLDEHWEVAAQALKKELHQQGLNCDIVGRATKQKVILGRDFVHEALQVQNKTYLYRQVENSFTQPNGKVNEKMLSWAAANTHNSQGDLLELYCGNGNFSIALAQNFNQVLATEISKSSVQSAQHNIEINQISNLKIVRLSAEELTQALNGEREFRRLEGIDLKSYDCRTVLVDPPRAGLDLETLKMISNYPKIMYISCNPKTLKANLEQLLQTHQVEKMALFDQFPYTEHVEIGMILVRK